MRQLAFLALAVLGSALAHGAWAPPKYDWPAQFDVGFGLTSPTMNAWNQTCHLYYDWTAKVQMINYIDNCMPGLGVDGPCRLFFNDVGTWLNAKEGEACLLHPGIGIVRIDFLTPFNYSNNETAKDWAGNKYECYHWLGISQFEYWTTPNQHDITMLDGGTIYWHYGPFNVRPQNASTFMLPPSLTSSCPKPSGEKAAHYETAVGHLSRMQEMFHGRGRRN